MAEPAQRYRMPEPPLADDDPPVDPTAFARAYRMEKARRRARIEHRRNTRRAQLRFWVLMALFVGVAVFLVLLVWQQVQEKFGL
jgi:hypothetical protein